MVVLLKSTCTLKFLLEGLNCYKDSHIKDYDITELSAETKSSDDNVRYRNKI